MATQISREVYKKVLERDKWCIVCGSFNVECHHFIYRSSGGLGIEENLVMLCPTHHLLVHSQPLTYRKFIESYLKSKYPNWSIEKLKYRKGENI